MFNFFPINDFFHILLGLGVGTIISCLLLEVIQSATDRMTERKKLKKQLALSAVHAQIETKLNEMENTLKTL